MKNNFFIALKITIVLAITITVSCIVLNLEVAQIILYNDFSSSSQLEKTHPHSDISEICVQYVTGGTMWKIVESTAKTKTGDAFVFSLFDLRCLKDNEHFLIDFHYDFIVCTSKNFSFLLGDKYNVIIPSKVYARPRSAEISKENDRQFFYVSDLNFYGKVKIFLRSFLLLFSGYFLLYILKYATQKMVRCVLRKEG